MSGAPSVEHDLALGHTEYVTFTFVLPLIVAALLEAGIAFASDALDRRRLVLGAQAALAASLLLAGLTRNAWLLAAGLSLAGASSGVACAAAQALLLGVHPGGAERAMVRWAVFAAIGDMLTPLLTAAAVALGFSYRGAMLFAAAVVAVQCATTLRLGAQPPLVPKQEDPDSPVTGLREALASAARKPRLWAWLAAAASCTLLDELVVALAVLRMAREQSTSEATAAAAAVAFAAGGLAGLAITDQVLARLGRRRVLLWSAGCCALALGALFEPESAVASAVALFAVGVTCAPHHALTMAAAYEEMPRNPGVVQALSQLFVVVDVVAPLALGLVADRFGLRAAIACLALQPATIIACAAVARRRQGTERL